MLKKCLSALLATTLLSSGMLGSGLAWADEERATAATETRQGLLKVVVMYFGPVLGMVREQIPFDAAVVEANATRIAQLAEMIPDAFAMDTRAYDVDTEALDGIWDNRVDFNDKAETVGQRAQALAAAASGGLDATRKAFGALGGACKACHDEYREQN